MNGPHFDPYSAIVGGALTLVLVVLGYWLHQPLLRGLQKVRGRLARLTEWVTAGVEERYRRAVIDWAQQAHALAMLGSLEQLFVPPRLIPTPSRPDPYTSPVPVPLPLGIALRGHRRLLLVGEPASGRSTLLAYLALVHAQREAGSLLGLPAEQLPLYVHLAGVDWPSSEEGDDGEKPRALARLTREGIRAVGGPSAVGGALRQHLQAGAALVLVDGWDELSAPKRTQAAAWLVELVDSLPGNLWLVVTGQRGYAPLTGADFVPLRLERWGQQQAGELLTRCAELLSRSEEEEGRIEGLPLPQVTDALLQALDEEPSLLDLALRTWLLLDLGEAPAGHLGLLMQALERLLGPSGEETWLPEIARAALGSLALAMYQEDRSTTTAKEVEEALEAALPPQEEYPPRATPRALRAVTASGSLLHQRGGDRYTFAHPLWQACLAAWQLKPSPTPILTERLDDPHWLPVLDFYAEVGQMEPVVEAWLAQPDDLWRTRLRTAARWAAFSPPDVPWRNGVMALLARTFLEPALPTRVREQLAEVLVRTGDPGLPVFLRHALQNQHKVVRSVAAQAMGRLRKRADLVALVETLKDPHEAVRAAAAFALGRVGTPAAIRQLTQALLEGEESLQVEAARGLAHSGETGWKVLREAMDDEDFIVRRAAVYGLGEVDAPWARDLLQKAAHEDDQWIVRSAAAALAEVEAVALSPVYPPLAISEMGWLITWAAERGEGVGKGEAALGPLLSALEEGEHSFRRAAAEALGMVAGPEHAAALRRAVDDPDPEVAQAALQSLGELAARYDLVVQ